MATYAEIDAAGRVLQVVVCDDLEWLVDRLGGEWIVATENASPGMYFINGSFLPAWEQPLDAEAAYPLGFRVYHAGAAWENFALSNTSAPGISGWSALP